MKRFILVLAIICTSVKVAAQQFYIINSKSEVHNVTIVNGVASSQVLTSCSQAFSYAIAMNQQSFYYCTLSGQKGLYKASIVNNAISGCTFLSDLGGVVPTSLTINNSGTLYYASGKVLYKIDVANPVPVTIGTMPYTSAGDLAFYKNELYMASTANGIVKLDLANLSNSSVYVPLPNYSGSLFGLTSVTVNNTVEFYAFSQNNGQTDVLEIDMANQKLIGKVGTLPYIVSDAASPVEGGTTPVLHIDAVTITQQCSLQNKGQVQVSATPDLVGAVLTYSLNNAVSNTTGLFTNLSPGSYGLHVSSTTGTTKDTLINVPDYTFNKNALSILKTNPVCNIAGKIQFGIPNSNLYTVQYNTVGFPINHAFTGLAAGSYSFTILNQGGCPIDTVDVTLTQDICIPNVTFPNTFTPNNDGINDIFKPNATPPVSNYKLSIYNRWGTLIFVSADINTGWDGLYQGKPAGTGTYYWIADFTGLDGAKNSQNGSVTLIR